MSHLVTIVTFIRDSSDIFQLKESPLTKPETMTNKSTSTLMAVKILLTHADSLTPKERRPGKIKSEENIQYKIVVSQKVQFCVPLKSSDLFWDIDEKVIVT